MIITKIITSDINQIQNNINEWLVCQQQSPFIDTFKLIDIKINIIQETKIMAIIIHDSTHVNSAKPIPKPIPRPDLVYDDGWGNPVPKPEVPKLRTESEVLLGINKCKY
jgi:hypothetical protein